MTHVRNQIRDAVALAVTGLVTTKKNVFTSRVHPVNDNELPCLLVFTRAENSTIKTMTIPRRLERITQVMVEGVVKLNESYDDKLDKISVEVEKAIQSNTSLQSLVRDIVLTDTEIKLVGDAEKPVAMISMSFQATYHVLENDPETIS